MIGDPMPTQAASDMAMQAPLPVDFIVVDEGGDFSYYPSEASMLEDLEYPEEAACIVDRSGDTFRLARDEAGNLRLGRAFGPVEVHWLHQAWTAAQHRNLREHPIQRLYEGGREAFLQGLFEVLVLEHGKTGSTLPWSVNVRTGTRHPATLKGVDELLKDLDDLSGIDVRDPYGHTYRPVRQKEHTAFPFGAGFICYVEVPAPVR